MRIFILAMCLTLSGILQAHTLKGQDLSKTYISLQVKNSDLKSAFKKIETLTTYRFSYKSDDVSKYKSVNLTATNQSLDQILTNLLKNTDLSFEQVDKAIIIKKVPQNAVVENPAQQNAAASIPIIVTGKVTDTLSTPLIGATIVNNQTNKSTITDDKGEFSISANSGEELVITYIGYKAVVIPVTPNMSYVTIALHPSISGLSEVTVSTGYQTLPKERATGSFATVDNKLFNYRVSPDVITRLEGNVPGLLFNHTTSNSNRAPDINIRGHSTLFSNDQPLIVVDNFPYDGDINNINPNDIESVSILKDAAAASIWGVRSGNGVIVITTKKGRRNQKIQVDLNANVTIGAKPNLYYNKGFLDANDYINVEQKLFNSGYFDGKLQDPTALVSPVIQILANQRAGTISDATAQTQINSLRGNDVRSDLTKYFYQNSVNQQYALNLRGGTDNSDYIFSLGDDNDLSNQIGNKNGRLSFRSLINFYPVKNLQLTGGITFTQTAATNNSSIVALSGHINPYTKLADANGNPLAIPIDLSPNYKSSAESQGLLDWQFRPLAEIGLADNTTKGIDNTINLGATYKFPNGFSIDAKYQYEKSTVTLQDDQSLGTYYARNLINTFTQINQDGTLTYPVPVTGGILQQQNAGLTSQQFRTQLNYSHVYNQDSEFNAIAGAEIRQSINESNSNIFYGYDKNTQNSNNSINFYDSFPENPNGSGTIPNSSGLAKSTNNFISYFANGAYSYKSRYTLSLSGRIDHSNLFGVNTNQKAVPLYSAGFSWNLSNENFYHLDFIPVLKPRFTYGYTANINTSAAAVTTIFQRTNSAFYNLNYAALNNPGNPELKWEKTKTTNLGLDYGLKNNIVSGSVEYYWKRGIDLFGSSSLPPSTGLDSFFGNTSSTTGHGFDIVINTKNIDNGKFKWTTNLLLSSVQDKVTSYNVKADALTILGGSGGNSSIVPIVGAPLFSLYSFKWAGLSHETGDPQGFVNGKPSTDYSTIISSATADSLQYSGSARPTTFGSIRNTFTYGKFSLSVNIIGKFNYYFRKNSISDASFATSFSTGSADFLKAWQKPGDEAVTNVPSIQYPPINPDRQTFYTYSSVLIDKADNIRLQDMSLSYDLDKSQWRAMPFTHLQFYGYVSNVAILWRANKDHLDPDMYSGGTIFSYPSPRTFAFGIKANF